MWGMALFLALAALAFHWIPINHDLSLKTTKVGWPAYVVLACMIIYVGFYSSGMGNTAWLSSEFFPMEVRAYGTMMRKSFFEFSVSILYGVYVVTT